MSDVLLDPTASADRLNDFAHLHVHSEYSLLDGLSPVEELVRTARDLGLSSLALTDHGNLYGAIDFYDACKQAGLKPILGVEAYVAPRGRADREVADRNYFHLVLLAENETGWRNLLRLVTIAHTEGYYYKPRIDRELLAQHHEGLIALSACYSGEPARAILDGDVEKARQAAAWYRDLFGPDRYYLELQDHGNREDRVVNQGLLELSRELGIPVVATNDLHYARREQAAAQDILLAIQTNSTLEDPKRMRMQPDAFYLKSAREMAELFGEVPQALWNTLRIAERVSLQLTFDRVDFPALDHLLPPGQTPIEFLARTCRERLRDRYPVVTPEVRERLEYELRVVEQTGFAAYILFVWDYVDWARRRGIPAAPRGSAAGSIILYLLGISDVDPIEYGLTFERFLNPERVQMPDIDMDFADRRRDEVIDYVVGRYGQERVAQIATFGRLLARAAIRDVGRTLNYPLHEVDRVAKLIPAFPIGLKIEQAIKDSPELQLLIETQPSVQRLIDAAKSIEGVVRNVGTHAAGIVVSREPLVHHVPLQRASRGESLMAQFHMKALEKIGLLKMDFLGLANLTMIETAVRYIEKTRGVKLDLSRLPLDDARTFEMLARGETATVFQLEGAGMTRYIKELKPQSLRHLAAMVALYRPGPMAHIPSYIARKEGREPVTYLHPSLEPVLRETYGIIVYQDQVLQVVQTIAGYTLGQADILRRAMGKKLPEEMRKQKASFLAGALQRGYSEEVAGQLWEWIEPFAGYAFNKCVVGDTMLTNALTGERASVESLFRAPRPFTVHSLDETGRLRPRRVIAVLANGVKPVFELRTRLGHRIVATGNHPFRTLDGWTSLEELKPGDRVAAPRRLVLEGGASWPRHELVVLAGLLAEGNTCHPSALYFSNRNRALVDDFVAAVSAFPDTVARVTTHENGGYVVWLNTGRAARCGSARGAASATAVVRTRSGAYAWAERLGITGKRATQKRIPDPVFQLRDADLELFLGRLWSADGFIANVSNRVPFYATSSEALAYGVQSLLLRLGIVSGVHRKRFRNRRGPRVGWTVHLVGEDSTETFARRVLPHVVGRDEAAAVLLGRLRSTSRGMASVDTLPAGVRRWVDEEGRAAGLTWKALEQRSGVAMREFIGRGSIGKRGFRRNTLRRLAACFESERLRAAAAADVFWDEVVAIEPRGEQPTYDLTVEVDHNFVANGLIVHNSHAVMYAHIAYQTAYLKANYPVEWMAAVLTTEAESSEKVVSAVGECRRLGIPVLRPDVNKSSAEFSVEPVPVGPFESRFGIRYSLAAIKNVGAGAVEAIIAERERNGPYRSLEDLCRRVDTKTVNKRVLESLIKAGAFDDLGRREQHLDVLDRCLAAGQQQRRSQSAGQASLFDLFGDPGRGANDGPSVDTIPLPSLPPVSRREELNWEKEVLGFYLSDHPFQEAARQLADRELLSVSQLAVPDEEAAAPQDVRVRLAGIITNVRRIVTKARKETMAAAQLEDLTGAIEIVAFPKVYAKTEALWREDAILIVEGRLDTRNERRQVIVESAEEFVPAGQPDRATAPPVEAVAEARQGGAGLGGWSDGGGDGRGQPAGNGPGARNSNGARAAGRASGDGHGGTTADAAPPSHPTGARAAEGHPMPPPGRHGDPAEAADPRSRGPQHDPSRAGVPSPARLRLVVPLPDDPHAGVRLLEQLHRLLGAEGPDGFELELRTGAKRYRVSVPTGRTRLTVELERQLQELLGAQNVAVEPLAPRPGPASAPPEEVGPVDGPSAERAALATASGGPVPDDPPSEPGPPRRGIPQRADLPDGPEVRQWW